MQVLVNALYEFDKGVRHLFLLTVGVAEIPSVLSRLNRDQVAHFVQKVNQTKANVFFGKEALVETARHIARKPLNQITPEEDFMLGTLLSYDKERQCLRYLDMIRGRSGMLQAAE
jgi:hypothetical protein